MRVKEYLFLFRQVHFGLWARFLVQEKVRILSGIPDSIFSGYPGINDY
jgi:hypothetical protein